MLGEFLYKFNGFFLADDHRPARALLSPARNWLLVATNGGNHRPLGLQFRVIVSRYKLTDLPDISSRETGVAARLRGLAVLW
jgi:hypothetical protein